MDDTTLVIGLVGAKGAGKSTVFQHLAHRIPVTEVTLAGYLKTICAEIFDIPRDYFEAARFKELPLDTPVFLDLKKLGRVLQAYNLPIDMNVYCRPHIGKILLTPRQVAQYIGTEVLRSVDSDIHCKKAVDKELGRFAVVTDMRFPSEYDFFYSRFKRFIPIFIHRKVAEFTSQRDHHESEAHWGDLSKKCAYVLDNNSTTEELERRVQSVLMEILRGI